MTLEKWKGELVMEQKKSSPKKPSLNKIIMQILLAIIAAGAFLFLAFLAPRPVYKRGFETLSEVVADANSKEELAQPEDFKDHRRPSWKTYHTKTQPGFFGREWRDVLSMLYLRRRPYWSPSYFKYLLEKRIKEREAKGLSAKYEYVHRIVPTEKTRLIIWGDMYGAYHSMVRSLQKLVELDVIDDNFKLKSPDDYLAFMGDVAIRSPFIMELLTLIMKLEERNPDRVIYISGNNERQGSWYPYGLRQEIEFKAPGQTSKAKPLYKTVEQYFETLPLAIYASIPPHTTNEFVRLSHFAMEVPSKETYREFVEILNDAYYSTQLLKDRKVGVNNVVKISKKRGIPDKEQVSVRAIIKSYRKTREYQKNEGLRYLVPDKNAVAWTPLSCPTVFVHHVLDFWNDAFVILQAAPKLEDWAITLYTRDIRTKEDFRSESYNFLSGKNLYGGKEAIQEKAPEKTSKPKKNNRVTTGQIRR